MEPFCSILVILWGCFLYEFKPKQTPHFPTTHLNFQFPGKSPKTDGFHQYLCETPFGQTFARLLGNFLVKLPLYWLKKNLIHNVILLCWYYWGTGISRIVSKQEKCLQLLSKYHSYLQPGPVHILRQFHTDSVCYNKCFIRINLLKRQEHMNSSWIQFWGMEMVVWGTY